MGVEGLGRLLKIERLFKMYLSILSYLPEGRRNKRDIIGKTKNIPHAINPDPSTEEIVGSCPTIIPSTTSRPEPFLAGGVGAGVTRA